MTGAYSGSDAPPGWSRNPSAWSQRLPLVGVALLGAIVAAYLGAYQLGLVSTVWDPFFGDGSERVLESKISTVLPIPDAALGVMGYLLDVITGLLGGQGRWRTAPWLVVLFGVAIGPLGAVSVLLVILQPVSVGAWCTLCLASAALSVLMIGPAMDEVLASLQMLARVRQRGRSVWRAFWRGEEAVA